MNWYTKLIFSTILVTAIVAGCAPTGNNNQGGTLQPLIQGTSDTTTTRTVQVSGTGEIQAAPDTVIINLGVQTQAKTAQAALETNNTQMQTLVDALKKGNIPSEDIQTQTIRLSPRYDYNNTDNTQTLIGYTASNVVQISTTDLESVGTLLDQAVKAGANTIDNISFEISDTGKLLDQAREKAVQDARHKAEALASLTGTSLGPIVEIQESSSTPAPVVRQFEAASAAPVPVSPGSQSVSVQVQVTWELIVKSNN